MVGADCLNIYSISKMTTPEILPEGKALVAIDDMSSGPNRRGPTEVRTLQLLGAFDLRDSRAII